MPKVINQNEALIEKLSMQVDSLSAKLQHLDTKVTVLKSNNHILADSISTLTKSVNQSSIATTFYDTHLATYTAIFGALIAILGLVSLGWIKKRFEDNENKITEVSNELLPNAIVEIREFHDSFKIDIQKESKIIKNQADLSLSWGLKSLILLFQNNNKHSIAILFMFRYIDFVLEAKRTPSNDDITTFRDMISLISESLEDSGFKEEIYKDHKIELDKIFEKIKLSNIELLQKFYFSELLSYLADNNQPTSAIDVDPTAGELFEQSRD